MITNSTVVNWFDHLFCKKLHTYEFPRSYIYMADTLSIIGPIAETTLNFIIRRTLGIGSFNWKELESMV